MLHDRAQNRGFEHLPVDIGRLGHGDEISAQEHSSHIADLEQALRQGRARRGVTIGEIRRASAHYFAPGQKLQSRRIGGFFGLNEHGLIAPNAFMVLIIIGLAEDRTNHNFY